MSRVILLSAEGRPIHSVEISPGGRVPEGWLNQSNCKGIAWPETVTFQHDGQEKTVALELAHRARGQFLRAIAKIGGVVFGVNIRKGNVEARPSFLATYTCKVGKGKLDFAGPSDRVAA